MMGALYAIWKRLGHTRLDGVNYDICVRERSDGRYSVTWVCLSCCEQGPLSPSAESVEQGIAFAHIGLQAHHSLFHRKLADEDGLDRDWKGCTKTHRAAGETGPA
jgi:hypothetical protein